MRGSRNYALDSDAVTTGLRSFLTGVSERDTSILEMASMHAGYDGWRGGVEFQADAAALRARRIVGVMLAKEAGPSAIRPGLAPNSRAYSLSPDRPLVLGG
jgi:vanillate O-demethylase monooxygenase subunit